MYAYPDSPPERRTIFMRLFLVIMLGIGSTAVAIMVAAGLVGLVDAATVTTIDGTYCLAFTTAAFAYRNQVRQRRQGRL